MNTKGEAVQLGPGGGSLLRVREVCSELAIGRSLVYEMINDGRLRAVRVGKRATRIPRTEVARFVSDLREVRGEL